ncbi:MAG: metallopeptidase TldD-related protein, partial [Thermoanaerobaculia bacterium]|nr:metallopeptidase TldD-related protein [Thermoanaerobaculia bacterium]
MHDRIDSRGPSRERPDREALRALLSDALERSPADETSISWLEVTRRQVGHRWPDNGAGGEPRYKRDVQVRVLEAGRLGTFRTEASSWGGLERAIRQAMAHARTREKIPGFPHLPRDRSPLPELPEIRDETIQGMSADRARRELETRLDTRERGHLTWGDVRLAVASSHGLSRFAVATEIRLEVASGPPGTAGYAARATRTLDRLPWETVIDRARARQGTEEVGSPPTGESFPVVLAPEATAQLLDVVNRRSLTAWDYELGDTFLREFLGVQVFDRSLELVDDATDPDGLPFPFDLEGTAKRPVAVIEHGVPRTPALDQYHAARWGLPATPHACADDDARFEHLA